MTLPEVLLWQALRKQKTGLKFRRQHPIGAYIADFCCLDQSLIVEVDGNQHGLADRDRVRDRFLEENGFRVIRIGAKDVLRDIEAVVTAIVSRAAAPLHHASHGPPPRSGEE